MNNEHNLPYELEDMPEDVSFGRISSFSESEVESFAQYDTFVDDTDLYLGDGKNIYQVRKRMLEGGELVLTADCIGVCSPDEYEMIMENEDGFESVIGYVESDFAFYTEEDGFIHSPAQTTEVSNDLDIGSNAANKSVRRVLEESD